ncbi:MAG: hypothetical protein Q4B42_05930 [Oscillospiraceae bacterium]|nr:hypothetical protein [Oscillospiraceae bacterium]
MNSETDKGLEPETSEQEAAQTESAADPSIEAEASPPLNGEGAQGEKRRFKLQLDNKDPDFKNTKERLYDKIPLSVKQLDVILVILAILFVVFFVLGIVRGQGPA